MSGLDSTKQTKTSWWKAHRPTTRRLIQLYSALLHNAYLKGFIDGKIYTGNVKYACVPGLNCYSCPGATGACPLGAFQNALASAGHRAGFYVLGILLLYGVILGRTICGWLCPMGLLQELLHKIPAPKIRKSMATRILSWLKYVILIVFAIIIPLYYGLAHDLPMPGFCKYICPAGTFEGAIGHLVNPANDAMFSMLGLLFTRKFIILLVIVLACIFCYRSFCRFLCPLGAIYGLFNRINVIGVKVDESRCNHCGACVRKCRMDVRHVGDHECINCGECMAVCHQEAISIKAGKLLLAAPGKTQHGENARANSKKRLYSRLITAIALVFLCFALIWFNYLDPASVGTGGSGEALPINKESYESDAPVGHEVGQQLQDFTLNCYDGSEFHLADTRGKVTIINLWATYCTPCIQELPYFSDLYQEHREEIAMIAVHPKLVTTDPEEFLSDKELAMPFATDTDGTVNEIVGGNGALPQTIVLNPKGEVIYNNSGSVTPELLAALLEDAEGK